MARMEWNQRELDRLLNSRTGPVGKDLDDRARRVEEAQKQRAPVSADGSHGREPGYMRDSITVAAGRDGEGQYRDIGPTAETPEGAPYPLFVELGTKPHTIPGAFGREGEVQHPGTEAQPFIRPSIEVIRDQ